MAKYQDWKEKEHLEGGLWNGDNSKGIWYKVDEDQMYGRVTPIAIHQPHLYDTCRECWLAVYDVLGHKGVKIAKRSLSLSTPNLRKVEAVNSAKMCMLTED